MKTAPIFCFGCRRHKVFENLADDQICPVDEVFVGFVFVAQLKEPPSPAFGFIF
jgi:hypothetical protein